MSLEEEKLKNEINSLKSSLLEKDNSLKKIQEKLKLKNQEHEDFVYIVSHDLNEPLRTVNSFIKIINEEYHNPNNEELNTYFSFIESAVIKMKDLINVLSDFSKIGINQSLKKANINKVIDSITEEISVLIQQKGVVIKKNNLPEIQYFKSEIKMLFKQLILNAIKFQNSNTKPIINISCKEDNDYWFFSIKDNGIGIDSKHFEDIFKIFNKLHADSEYDGIGVGLAFCKKIVEMHGGKISVKSQLNQGSEFYFSISKKFNANE